jgi:hypothetical protein
MEKKPIRIPKPHLFVIILIVLVMLLIGMTIWLARQQMGLIQG